MSLYILGLFIFAGYGLAAWGNNAPIKTAPLFYILIALIAWPVILGHSLYDFINGEKS